MEISERIKRPGPRKDSKDRSADVPISKKHGSYSKAPFGASFVKDAKVLCSGKTMDLSVSSVTRRDTMQTSVLMQRRRKGRGTSRSGSSKSHQPI